MRRPPLAEFFRRLFAVGGAALVLALSIFAASPAAHDLLHGHGTVQKDDTCAVVLFAGGVALPLDMPVAVPAVAEWQPQPPAVAEEIFFTSPRYLHQPERGPPSDLIG